MSLPQVTSQLILQLTLQTYYLMKYNNGFQDHDRHIHLNPPGFLHQPLLHKQNKEEHDRNCLIGKREVIGYNKSHTQVHTFLAAPMA